MHGGLPLFPPSSFVAWSLIKHMDITLLFAAEVLSRMSLWLRATLDYRRVLVMCCHWTVWCLFVTAHRCHCLTVAVQQEAGWAPGSVRTPWKRESNRRFSVVSPWRSHCTDWPVPVYRTTKYCNKICRSLCPGLFCPWALWSDCASVVAMWEILSFLNLNNHVETELWLDPELPTFKVICITHFHSPSPDILFGMFVQKRIVSFTLCAI